MFMLQSRKCRSMYREMKRLGKSFSALLRFHLPAGKGNCSSLLLWAMKWYNWVSGVRVKNALKREKTRSTESS